MGLRSGIRGTDRYYSGKPILKGHPLRRSPSLAAAALFASAVLPVAAQTPRTKPVTDAEVASITRDAILIDTHDDVTSKTVGGYNIATPNKGGQTDLARMKGFLGAEFFAVYVGAEYVDGNHSANRALQMIDTTRTDIIAAHPNDFVFATTADEIVAAHNEHKIAALMGIEGGHAIEDSLRLLRDYYALGVRYMTLTHFNTNNWADSQGDFEDAKVKHHNGLTPFGKDVVREMNRLGMMVDISHVADKTFWDAIATTKTPVIASHSSARALVDAPRNMTDDMLKAVAKNGGVVQVNFFNGFIDENFRKAEEAQRPDQEAARQKYLAQMKSEGKEVNYIELDRIERQWIAKIPRPPLKSLIDHIDHIAKVAGVDHVGLGSDFDGVSGATPQGIDSAADLPKITEALLDRGYSAEDIHKILGGNLMRVFREVEHVSHEMQAASSR
jgi:membrane dipeptidase